MKHPPYHLRQNKAVDRLLLMDAIDILKDVWNLSEYTYYGLGGPFLEDFRLIYESFPGMRMISLEEDPETIKRQRFHLPCSSHLLQLQQTEVGSFLANFTPEDNKCIFWLDYTNLEYTCFEGFMTLLEKVPDGSLVKLTLRAEPKDFQNLPGEPARFESQGFRAMFGEVLPADYVNPPTSRESFARLLKDMIRIASEKTLSSAMPNVFQPVTCFSYADGVGIFTITGLVCSRIIRDQARKAYLKWEHASLDWEDPILIDVPTLTTKERLHLQEVLPCEVNPGEALRAALGYLIDSDEASSISRLKQYAAFHRHAPYLMKGIP